MKNPVHIMSLREYKNLNKNDLNVPYENWKMILVDLFQNVILQNFWRFIDLIHLLEQ